MHASRNSVLALTLGGLLMAGIAACGGSSSRGSGEPDLTQQPTSLDSPGASAHGGHGGEGERGGDGGFISGDAEEILLLPPGASLPAGAFTGAGLDPDAGSTPLVVAAGDDTSMTAADLDQTWSSIHIAGTLTLDLTGDSVVDIFTTGDAVISGRIDYENATEEPELTIQGTADGSVHVSGEIDLASRDTGLDGGTVDLIGFDRARVSGRIDVSGISADPASETGADNATDGGAIQIEALSELVVDGTLRADGGDSVQSSTERGGEGGDVVLVVDDGRLIVRSRGLQTFGGGGALLEGEGAGAGGDGGAIELTAGETLEVRPGVIFRTSGGRANGNPATVGFNLPGGDAGAIRLRVDREEEAGPGTLVANGRFELFGGFSPADEAGAGGDLRAEIAGSEESDDDALRVGGEILSLGGATESGQGGLGGLVELLLQREGGLVRVDGRARADGGPAVGTGEGGDAGVVYIGAGSLPPTSPGDYAAVTNEAAEVPGLLQARGGRADAGVPGDGGLIHVNVDAFEARGAFRATAGANGAPAGTHGQVTTRVATDLQDAKASVEDDDDLIGRTETRPADIRLDLGEP